MGEGKFSRPPNYWLMQTVLIRNLHVQTQRLRRGTMKLGPVVVSVFTQLDSASCGVRKETTLHHPPPLELQLPHTRRVSLTNWG